MVAMARLNGQAIGAALVALCYGLAGARGPTVALALGSVFAALAGGPLAATQLRIGVNVPAGDADDYLIYHTDTGILYYDADGNGPILAVPVVTLTGAPAITAGDIVGG